MGTIADKTNYLIETKSAIKQSLINKGAIVGETDTFRSYAEKIDNLDSLYYFTNADYFFKNDSRIDDYLSNKSIYNKMLLNITSAEHFLSSGLKVDIDYIGIFKELNMHNKKIPLVQCFSRTRIISDIEDLTIAGTICSNMFEYAGHSEYNNKVLGISFPNAINIGSLFLGSFFTEIHDFTADVANYANYCFKDMRYLTWLENISLKNSMSFNIISGCTKLEKINNLDLREAYRINIKNSLTGSTTLTALTEITGLNVSGLNTEGSCLISTYTPNLARLTFTGTSIPDGLNITNTAMVKTGIVEMFNSFPTTGTSKNIVLGATKLALLSTADKAIATGKGYTLS